MPSNEEFQRHAAAALEAEAARGRDVRANAAPLAAQRPPPTFPGESWPCAVCGAPVRLVHRWPGGDAPEGYVDAGPHLAVAHL